MQAQKAGTPIICCMGAGNKMDPTRVRGDGHLQDLGLSAGESDAHASCKKRGIKQLKVVYSKEPAHHAAWTTCPSAAGHTASARLARQRKCTQRRQVPSSNAFVPAAVGLIVAGEVVKDLTAWERPL